MNNYYINEFGTKIYNNEKGQLHREDGPAYEGANGDKEWWVNGKLHRLNGPAAQDFDGDKYWYLNDKLHRIDGPAIEYAHGSKEWFINFNDISSVEDFLLFVGCLNE